MRQIDSVDCAAARVLVVSLAATLLSAYGGSGSGTSATAPATAPIASAPTTTQSYSMTLAAPSDAVARPAFHLAPVFFFRARWDG
jgi:hypothetical protein